DVHENVVADPRLGHVLEAHPPPDAAQLDLAEQELVLAGDLDDAAGDGQAHQAAPPRVVVAAAIASWPSASPPSFGGTSRWRSTRRPRAARRRLARVV